ncbi:MAG: hypothetical protein E6K78_06990 [Candidatus Eisenbacteria bacterium]|uniref:RNA polymerase sigma-70 region 2 domain-containing protein n=1 Tax=Eiseniibacteriota bacterium TaxID=2212470 RepID=A0A538TQF1_UNCEI|nr:MAG: hypothetical protein E6K78_06990 [Candidatus Eisenbacteria bacterium]
MCAKRWGTEGALLDGLRSGDEVAFATLVDDLHYRLLALAAGFTSSPALAEDIVQETWLAVIRGLRGFEGRSSLKTWIFSILVRRARTITAREARRDGSASRLDGAERASIVEWEPGRGRAGLWEETPTPWALERLVTLIDHRRVRSAASSTAGCVVAGRGRPGGRGCL